MDSSHLTIDGVVGEIIGRLKLKGLADTMRLLAKNGPRDFYEGEVARNIVKDIQSLGGVLDAEDLKNFHARIVAPLEVDYGSARVALAGGLTGGQSMAGVLQALAKQTFRCSLRCKRPQRRQLSLRTCGTVTIRPRSPLITRSRFPRLRLSLLLLLPMK
mgnify:CR=1 FL=1